MAFSITSFGKYRQRNGGIVTVARHDDEDDDLPWGSSLPEGKTALAEGAWWAADGAYFPGEGIEFDLDIVEGPLAQATDMAGLTGYVAVTGGKPFPEPHTAYFHQDQWVVEHWPYVIDLSTIRKDQLIAPEPKTIKGWVNIYDGWLRPSKEEADNNAVSGRIACVEVEFTRGDGL